MEKLGVMVCGHGSRDEGAVREFEAVARGIRKRLKSMPGTARQRVTPRARSLSRPSRMIGVANSRKPLSTS